jgi:hypothetical protein
MRQVWTAVFDEAGNGKLSIGGKIEIDLETGKVTLTDCDLDEASKLFWDAVNVAVPLNTRSKGISTSMIGAPNWNPPEPMNVLYDGQMMTQSTFDLLRKNEKQAAIPKDSGQV